MRWRALVVCISCVVCLVHGSQDDDADGHARENTVLLLAFASFVVCASVACLEAGRRKFCRLHIPGSHYSPKGLRDLDAQLGNVGRMLPRASSTQFPNRKAKLCRASSEPAPTSRTSRSQCWCSQDLGSDSCDADEGELSPRRAWTMSSDVNGRSTKDPPPFSHVWTDLTMRDRQPPAPARYSASESEPPPSPPVEPPPCGQPSRPSRPPADAHFGRASSAPPDPGRRSWGGRLGSWRQAFRAQRMSTCRKRREISNNSVSLAAYMMQQLDQSREEPFHTRKMIFQKLLRQLHPDKNIDRQEEAKLAFQQLMELRASYLASPLLV